MNSSFSNRTVLARGALATVLVVSGVVACSSSPPASKEQTATTSDALTITGLFRTGVDDLGAQLPLGTVDPHYKVSSTDVRCASTNAMTTARTLLSPPTSWINNISPANWISCQTNGNGDNLTDYTYTTSFTLPAGVPPSTVTISGLWACDDYCSIVVNGQDTGVISQNPNFNPSPPQPGILPAPTTFVVPAGSTVFRNGINTLQFVVHNVTGNQGLQIVSISGSAGCAVDSDCGTGTFCNTETEVCVPQLGNGVEIPTIPDHTPPLDGICTTEVGAIVCVSGVCDTADNLCGFDLGHACTANAECRSNECDAASHVCVPGCTVDSDCSAGNFCNTELQHCAPQLDNGVEIPTIPGHIPPLDGICTPDVGAVVCVSGVCDTADDLCGFDIGHACKANEQCRSNDCDPATCQCVPGCMVDSDCAAGDFCNTASHMCMPKLADGVPIPTIPGHVPPLDGICTPDVGALVCTSAVCDIGDNLCGFDLGHPCTENMECRSKDCDPNTNLCVPACAVDSDCAAGNFCNTVLFACVPLLDNGVAIPTIPGHEPPLDGICTPDVGAAVCASGVCDTSDNMCGLADGSGPCTDNAQCRSENCNLKNGICQPSLPCCGNTYGMEMGADAGKCIICDDAGVPVDAGKDASADAAPDSGSNVANGSDNTVQDPQGSGGNNPTGSGGNGVSASGGGGCQMGGGASNPGLGMISGLLAMIAAAWRRRQKTVQG